MQLDLIDGWSGLETAVGEKLLQVPDGKVGDTNVLNTARLGELLEFRPGVKEIPVRVVLLEVVGVGR